MCQVENLNKLKMITFRVKLSAFDEKDNIIAVPLHSIRSITMTMIYTDDVNYIVDFTEDGFDKFVRKYNDMLLH